MDIKELMQKAGMTTKTGKLNAHCVSEKYLIKHNQDQLRLEILAATAELPDWKFSKRCWAAYNLPVKHCENCGNPTRKNTDKKAAGWQRYCSKQCWVSDPNHGKKIAEAWSDVDKEAANRKRRATMKARFGVEYNNQRPEMRKAVGERSRLNMLSDFTRSMLDDEEYLVDQYFNKGRNSTDIAEEIGCDYSTVLGQLRKYGYNDIRSGTRKSKEENQIAGFIEQLSIPNIRRNDRKVLHPYELDIYLPDYNFAIEIDGVHWHSYPGEGVEDHQRHVRKTNACAKQGIKLVHILDTQWNNRCDLVCDLIKTNLGLNERVGARKLRVQEVNTKDAKAFLNKNHLQGTANGKVKLGLYQGNELFSIATFGKPRFNNGYDWELIRACSKMGTSVIGGFSKLLASFRKQYPGSIITYADRMISNGNLYLKTGFKLIKVNEPGYFWTDGYDEIILRSRSNKSALARWLPSFDPNKSEAVNMFEAKYRRFSDCGTLVFALK